MAKRMLIILVMAIFAIQGYAQLKSSGLEERYGQIRADIVKDACRITEYTNNVAIGKITPKSLNGFYEELEKDTCGNKLYSILKASHKNLSGTNVLKYDTLMTCYRNDIEVNLLKAYPDKRDIILKSMGAYIDKIHKLTEECNRLNPGEEDENAATKDIKPSTTKSSNRAKADVVTKEENIMFLNSASIHKLLISFIEIVSVIIAFLVIGFLWLKLYKKRKKAKRENKRVIDNDLTQSYPVSVPEPQTTPTPEGITPVSAHSTEATQDSGKESEQTTPTTETTSEPPTKASFNAFSEDAGEWIVVGASVQGNGHISLDLPCQDSCGYKYLQDGWGIAVTSDGAGSAKNSQVGSAIAVQRAIFHFENLIRKENWIIKNILPTESQWMKFSYKCLKLIHDEIEAFAKQKNVDFKSLSSTIIVVIHTPLGLLVCHIGDGRAGYMDLEGQWHSLITPHKGEEANQTIFIPSEFWNIPFYEMSGAVVPEARIITSKVSAFTLMSDGCESTSWQCNLFNEATGKYYDPNIPHKPFFDSVVETLKSFRKDGISNDERKNKWAAFIKDGNKSFIKESDDKTMIVGALYM